MKYTVQFEFDIESRSSYDAAYDIWEGLMSGECLPLASVTDENGNTVAVDLAKGDQ
jgi:hypothetical protein